MPDVGTIAAALSGLKTAGEIAKGLVVARDGAMTEGKIIELRGAIVAAQESALAANADQLTLLQRVRDLELRLADFEGWERERQRCQLTDLGGGTFAYVLKPGMADGEPPHRLCPQCYQSRKKGILQSHGTFSGGREKVSCQACGNETMIGRDSGARQSRAMSDYDPFTGR